jgi:branched-chain amino acid aminotransferase
MAIETKYIWMDGQLVETERATVPFLSPALHYGLGVFEGIRCYATDQGSAVFRLREHMERLALSAKVFGYRSLPYTVDELVEATKATIRANELKQCYIRPLIYHSAPNLGMNLDAGEPKVGIAAWEWGAYLGEAAIRQGIRAHVASFTRHHPNVTMTKAKVTGNYANSSLAKTESLRLGFDEAIMLDPQGYVAECTGENIFMVRRGVVYTPPLATVLEGITRDSLLTLAADLGIQVVEKPIGRDMLYTADEVFVCGTAAEVVALREIDFRSIGCGEMGPVTHRLQQAFFSVVQGQHARSAEWLDYV